MAFPGLEFKELEQKLTIAKACAFGDLGLVVAEVSIAGFRVMRWNHAVCEGCREAADLVRRRVYTELHREELTMQGTVVMLMALSGLGCHHKSAPVYAPASYSSCYSSCYSSPQAAPVVDCCPTSYVAPSCYSACYSTSYSGCYTSCYSSSCYSTTSYDSCYSASAGASCYSGGQRKHRHGIFAGLFGHKKARRCDTCNDFPVASGCYSTGYNSGFYGGTYAPAVYGSYTPAVNGSSQSWATGQATPMVGTSPTTVTTPSDVYGAAPVIEPSTPPSAPSAVAPTTPAPPVPADPTPAAATDLKLPAAPAVPDVAPPAAPVVPVTPKA